MESIMTEGGIQRFNLTRDCRDWLISLFEVSLAEYMEIFFSQHQEAHVI